MMRRFLDKRLAMVGLALIVAVNVVAGIVIVYNRGGQPDSVLALNQRELRLPVTTPGNAAPAQKLGGLSLRIDWQVLPDLGSNAELKMQYLDNAEIVQGIPRLAAWLDRAKLESLGYRFPDPAPIDEIRKTRPSDLAREVFVVLEFDGAGYRDSITRARHDVALIQAAFDQHPTDPQIAALKPRVEFRLAQALKSASRLYAIDAGLEFAAMRERYPDRNRYAVVRGKVRPLFRSGAETRVAGVIEDLTISVVNVPLRLRRVFELPRGVAFDKNKALPSVRYNVDLALGRRLEPWILNAEPAATAPGS
jgi:hypothetical protein